MSTIVLARKNGYAAIGADTLTKLGGMKESAEYIQNYSKIIKVGENCMATTGHASVGLVLESYFCRCEKGLVLDSPQSVFEMARQLHKALKEDYFLHPTEDEGDPFESSGFDCLIANPSGIFGIYEFRSVQEYSKFYSFGTGSKYAMGAMRVAFETATSAEAVVRAGLEAAVDFDGSTGPPVEVFQMALHDSE